MTKGQETMKAYEIGDQENIESLRLVDRDNPIAGPGQAVIKVHFSALNHRDLMIMDGRYGGPKPSNRIPVCDGAGEVIAIGENVTNTKLGDRVIMCHFTRWISGPWNPEYFLPDLGNTADGVLAERTVVSADCLVNIPESMSYKDASTLPVAANTSWHALETLGQMKAGDTVLTLGTGGVSVMALQLAKAGGARVAITSSSNDKLAKMRDLGADITVNYRLNKDWEKVVLEKTAGRGVDIVVETVGLGTLSKSIACTAPNGSIGMIGGLAQATEPPNLFGLLMNNISLKGITSGSRRMLEDALAAIHTNKVQPVVDRVFPFDKALDAYRYLESGAHVGKVVIQHS